MATLRPVEGNATEGGATDAGGPLRTPVT